MADVDRRQMRAADADRQAAAERLRTALGDGRLDFVEYDDRLARAYRAVTYGDLDDLFRDLPAGPAGPQPVPAPPRPPAPVSPSARRGAVPARRGMPTPLRVLWTIWASCLAVNLVVWLLVSIGNGQLDYFWPMWLLVPGAALAAVTGSVLTPRRPRSGDQRED